jgi:hypothetical protein
MTVRSQNGGDPLAQLERRVGRVDGVLGVFFRDCLEVRRLVASLRKPQHFRDPIESTNWIVFDGEPLEAYLAKEEQIEFVDDRH